MAWPNVSSGPCKEQVVYPRTFVTLEELRQAVAEFVQQYNRLWRMEKNGFRTPHELRAAHTLQQVARPLHLRRVADVSSTLAEAMLRRRGRPRHTNSSFYNV